jgi:hypothetical protein
MVLVPWGLLDRKVLQVLKGRPDRMVFKVGTAIQDPQGSLALQDLQYTIFFLRSTETWDRVKFSSNSLWEDLSLCRQPAHNTPRVA